MVFHMKKFSMQIVDRIVMNFLRKIVIFNLIASTKDSFQYINSLLFVLHVQHFLPPLEQFNHHW